MPNRSPKKKKNKSVKKVRKGSHEVLKYSGMAFEMFVIMGVFVFAGSKLDERFSAEKSWFTILGAILGITVAMVYTLRDFFFNKKE